MVIAHFYRSNTTGIYSVVLTGHADSGPYGYDLVCAAVSALSIGTANSLAELGEYHPIVEMNETSGGYLSMTVPETINESQQHTSQILLESLLLSLRSVADEYPKHLSIVEH